MPWARLLAYVTGTVGGKFVAWTNSRWTEFLRTTGRESRRDMIFADHNPKPEKHSISANSVIRHGHFRQKLERYKPAQGKVFRLVHHPHAAAAQPFDDAIVRDNLAKERAGVRHSGDIIGWELQASQRSGTVLKTLTASLVDGAVQQSDRSAPSALNKNRERQIAG
jgi:hypothetical protein